MKVTLSYSGDEVVREVAEGTTIRDLIDDPRNKTFFGYGQNVEPRVGSVPQSPDTPARDGMRVGLYDKACTKA